jgi:HK97 family phage prohead protease
MHTNTGYHQQGSQNIIIKSATEDKVMISGYASVYNIADYHNDLIVKGAFASMDHSIVKFLWQHDSLKPIGVIKSLIEDEHGLKIEAVINNKIQAGKEAIELVRQGAVDSFSIGFNIKLSSYNKLNQRIITKAELIEVSIVTFPANSHAKISYITKQIFHSMEDNMDTELITTKNYNNQFDVKINELKEKMNNIENFLSRPEGGLVPRTEHNAIFGNYIRKGITHELIQKSLHSGDEEGGILLIPALYNNIIYEISARYTIRKLA